MDFLDKVAHKLRENYGDEMDRQIVVLPSRRAGLYLSRFIARLCDKPQWSPMMLTVNELFNSFASLRQADTETLIFELYGIYKTKFTPVMSFDDFWSWGEIIVNDFNDIDLYLADAQKLYTNISDLKEIDAKFGGLTDEQTAIIRGFWTSFTPGSADSEARSRFQSVWQKLAPLYDEFRSAMRAHGQAGDGMLCREVAEQALKENLFVPAGMTWHIVGLNALNNCEKALFKYLKSKGQAKFYWDDDHFFMDDSDHKASVFMKENLKIFGNELEKSADEFTLIPQGRWTVIDTPSDTAQARMLGQIIEGSDIDMTGDLTDTAIILADEKLLLPVLTSLPQSIEEVNVTMGHPFRFTSLYSFLRQLMALIRSARVSNGKTSFRSEEVITLLRHQYFVLLAGNEGEKIVTDIISGNIIRVDAELLVSRLPLKKLFTVPSEGAGLPDHLVSVMEMIETATFEAQEAGKGLSIDREYLRMAMNATGMLANLMHSYKLDLRVDTCIRLLDRIFRKLKVPFSGEPLKGIQVMGALETRALEFSNIIFLSLNEGIFPGSSYDNTFIPYNIRRAFGLPTVNEHESIYSYHFFRLLRKPRQGWFMYNSTIQGLVSGEMSRYLVQMKYSKKFSTEFRTVHITVGRSRMIAERLTKLKEHNSMLLGLYATGGESEKYLSPSAVNTWVNCRMRFYYRYVCGMPEEEILEKDIDQRRFGNILHETLRRLYEPVKGTVNTCSRIKTMYADKELIRNMIISTASSEMNWDEATLMAGKGVIIIDVLERYVSDLLKYDSGVSDLVLLNLEDNFHGTQNISSTSGKVTVRIGGRADRVDSTAGAIRVVDYKTGTPKKDIVNPDDMFNEEKEKRNDALLQAMLYCHLIRESHPGKLVIPAVYWVQQISSDAFSPYASVDGLDGPGADARAWDEVMRKFAEGLSVTVNRIFSESEDYIMTDFVRRCTWCPYRTLCGR